MYIYKGYRSIDKIVNLNPTSLMRENKTVDSRKDLKVLGNPQDKNIYLGIQR